VGEEYDRLKKNKQHLYQKNRYVEGYTPGTSRPVVRVDNSTVISYPIVVEQVVRSNGLQVIQGVSPLVTANDGDYASNDQIAYIPLPGTFFIVSLNGRILHPAKDAGSVATSACYFTSSDGTFRPQGQVQIGDKLRWVGSVAGVEIEADDELLIIYDRVSQPVGTQFIQALDVSVTSNDGDYASTDGVSNQPLSGSFIIVTLNGVTMQLANNLSDLSFSACYFTGPNGAFRQQGQVQVGDRLRWVGSAAGLELNLTDELLLIYEI